MKKLSKILFAFSSLALLTGAVACDKTPDVNPEELVADAKAQLIYNTNALASVLADFELITEIDGVKITYSSSDTSVLSISADGKTALVTRPAFGEKDKMVVLTATLTYGDVVETKKFNVKVLEAGNEQTIADFLKLKAKTGNTIVVRGYVVAINARGLYVNDNTGYVCAFDSDIVEEGNFAIGDYVEVEGGWAAYKSVPQFTYNAEDGPVAVTKLSEKPDWTYTAPTPAVWGASEVDAYITLGENVDDATKVSGKYVEVVGGLRIADGYYNVDVPGATVGNKGLSLVYPGTELAAQLEELDGKQIKVTGYTMYNSHDLVNIFTTKVEEVNVTDAEKLQLDTNNLTVAESVKESFTLPTSGNYGSQVTWASNNAAIVIGENGAATVTQGAADVEVKLTATVTFAGATQNKEFTVVVKALEVANYKPAFAVEANKPYKIALNQENLEKTIYLDGQANSSGFLTTVESLNEAVDVYVEPVAGATDGSFNIYYEVDGAKKYLETYLNSSSKARYRVVDTAPAAGFVLDTQYNAIKSTVESTDYFMGTYNSFDTMSPSAWSYIESGNFIAHFYYEVSKYGDANYPLSVADACKVTQEIGNKVWDKSAYGYVTGIVESCNYSEKYSNYTLVIKDSAEATESFTVYGATFADGVEVAVAGDTIVACGTYYLYNTTCEFSGNNGENIAYPTVVSVNGNGTGGEDSGDEEEPVVDPIGNAATTVDATKTYKIALYQENLSKALYLNGQANSSGFLTTVETEADATVFHIEAVAGATDGSFNIYYEVDGAKKYLETYLNSSSKARYRVVDTAPAAGFVLDTQYNAIKSTVESTDYFMGTYNSFDTMSPSAWSYIESGNFIAHFYEVA